MEGKPIPEKDYAFYVEDLERLVSRNDIFKVLKEKFKAVSSRKVDSENGSRYRVHVISKETLERIKTSYEDPWQIKIIPLEEPSAQVDQRLDQKDGQNDISKLEEKPTSHEEIKPENIPNEPENGQKEALDNNKNSDPIGIGPGQAGQVGQSYSIEEIVSRAMGDKGYLTKDDFIFTTQMAPNLDWSEDDTEQTFYQLLQEGKLIEFEPGTYRPTQKLSESGGV